MEWGAIIAAVALVGGGIIKYALSYPRAYFRLSKPIVLVLSAIIAAGGIFDLGQYWLYRRMAPHLGETEAEMAWESFRSGILMTPTVCAPLLALGVFLAFVARLTDVTHSSGDRSQK